MGESDRSKLGDEQIGLGDRALIRLEEQVGARGHPRRRCAPPVGRELPVRRPRSIRRADVRERDARRRHRVPGDRRTLVRADVDPLPRRRGRPSAARGSSHRARRPGAPALSRWRRSETSRHRRGETHHGAEDRHGCRGLAEFVTVSSWAIRAGRDPCASRDTQPKGWSATLMAWISRPRASRSGKRPVPAGKYPAKPLTKKQRRNQAAARSVSLERRPALAVADRRHHLERRRRRDRAHRDRADQRGRRQQRDRANAGPAGDPDRGREPEPVGRQHGRHRWYSRRDGPPPRLREAAGRRRQADGRLRRRRVLPVLRRRTLVDGHVALALRHLQEPVADHSPHPPTSTRTPTRSRSTSRRTRARTSTSARTRSRIGTSSRCSR